MTKRFYFQASIRIVNQAPRAADPLQVRSAWLQSRGHPGGDLLCRISAVAGLLGDGHAGSPSGAAGVEEVGGDGRWTDVLVALVPEEQCFTVVYGLRLGRGRNGDVPVVVAAVLHGQVHSIRQRHIGFLNFLIDLNGSLFVRVLEDGLYDPTSGLIAQS